jgi:hypothetical protein
MKESKISKEREYNMSEEVNVEPVLFDKFK